MTKLRNIGYPRSDPKSGRAPLLQLPPSPHVSPFSLYECCWLQMQVGDLGFYILGGACPPLPGGRGLHMIKQKF